ncbi:hypothetical protein IXO1088_016465 [Xanthomonas oryzae pv. oryzae]|nr:hypothetical protein IXO1088_016465 [Xanthomonas oryzae pv. oryzae]UZK15703.1 DUF5597 domain-containing protein [Xanthomonas oryzae pv. oryzae]UZK19421.1 DUF5597 domain-containing protein [Xanthomonas oryzae pv. oryzae]
MAQLGPEEFLLTGMAARIEFSRNAADTRHGQLLRVEQGRYGDGRWQVQKQLNGDQSDDGLNFGRAPADGNVPVVLPIRLGTHCAVLIVSLPPPACCLQWVEPCSKPLTATPESP